MFEFDAGKLILIGIVALIVIGPKELPRVMLQLGQAMAKMRRMAAEFRSQFMDAMREAEIEAIKSDVAKLTESAKIDSGIDPLAQIKAELTSAMEAADKRAAPLGSPAIAAPGEARPSVSSAGPPRLPKAEGEDAETGAAAAPQGSSPARAAGTEIQALSEALVAEIGGTAPRHAKPDRAAAQDKV
jgi:sec-independent protein translocase protein TatB